MKKDKPLILVVNDDGLVSPGIKFLTNVMREIGDVFVVAPDDNRSGSSHSMTLSKDIFVEKVSDKSNNFICSGTPVDCVKIAVNKILPRLPDLCVSGINHGSNHSINALYSGTLHAAMEATIQGVPSIAFSHLNYSDTINLTEFHNVIKRISMGVLDHGLAELITLNVNFPDVDFPRIKGVKICTQGKGRWQEEFKKTKKEKDKTYYSITGKFQCGENRFATDSWALKNNFISIVPVDVNCVANLIFNSIKYLECDF